jgi:hypothetical protein
VYADSAYRSAETEAKLGLRGLCSRIHQRANRQKSKVRARIEHVFGTQQNSPGGRIVRTIGIARAKAKIGLQNLAYNIRRLVTLERMAAVQGSSVPGASQAGAGPTKHSLLTTNYEPKSPSRHADDNPTKNRHCSRCPSE